MFRHEIGKESRRLALNEMRLDYKDKLFLNGSLETADKLYEFLEHLNISRKMMQAACAFINQRVQKENKLYYTKEFSKILKAQVE